MRISFLNKLCCFFPQGTAGGDGPPGPSGERVCKECLFHFPFSGLSISQIFPNHCMLPMTPIWVELYLTEWLFCKRIFLPIVVNEGDLVSGLNWHLLLEKQKKLALLGHFQIPCIGSENLASFLLSEFIPMGLLQGKNYATVEEIYGLLLCQCLLCLPS